MKRFLVSTADGRIYTTDECEAPQYDPSGRWVAFGVDVFSAANVVCFAPKVV